MFLNDAVVAHLQDVAAWPDLAAGRYTNVRPLGAGGMGRVFAARDEPLGRDVAIKVSRAAAAGGELDNRLRQEAQVLAQLEHPGIVPVHDVGQLADGRVFYVMKLVQGRTLSETLATPVAESEALSVFERVADAVAFAHARGVVHRDLKPANIMVGPFGEVLVMDWGVAKLMAPVGVSPGPSVGRAGTPGFMAPEQASGASSAVGPASDVYALGALLFWLLRGTAPPASPVQVGTMLRAGSPRLPRRLRAMVSMCLAVDPAGRYPDASAVVADLARYRGGLAVDALPETLFDQALRFGTKHLPLIVLIAAYLIMRTLVAWW